MKRLPIGLQSFSKIRTGDYYYIDKTAIIFRLISSSNYFFLSRPQRFGKSLTVSTMKAYFEGRKGSNTVST
ncbi:MAG: AAA family ATPase [Bacteroidales bacterium]|nr:AAA family ATPase [Bacteroidales bacterium]